MKNSLTVFILDDNIPITQEYVDQSIYDGKINSAQLLYLIDYVEWKGEHNLRRLISDILKSNATKTGKINTYAFCHPELCLSEIEEGLMPDVIIFDWEYGSEPHKGSIVWLNDLLKLTTAFIFIYSQVRNEIPPFLNKKIFDKYSERFQLFLKGDTDNSIYSSEEFILQYVLSRVEKNSQIKIHDLKIKFTENGYLKDPSDILYLESILGRTFLISQFEEPGLSINNDSIERIIEKSKGALLFDSKNNFLIASDSKLLIDKFKPDQEMSYLEVMKQYGLSKLKEVLEVGLVKV